MFQRKVPDTLPAGRISDLMRGKIDLFSLDTLVNMAVAAGLHVELHVAAA